MFPMEERRSRLPEGAGRIGQGHHQADRREVESLDLARCYAPDRRRLDPRLARPAPHTGRPPV